MGYSSTGYSFTGYFRRLSPTVWALSPVPTAIAQPRSRMYLRETSSDTSQTTDHATQGGTTHGVRREQPGPGADVGGASAVPVQMWAG
jgi:hypothetical protein